LHPSGPHVEAPGERLSIDLTGRHPSSNQFVYCLTTEDYFSKFITLTPLRDKSAATVAKALLHSVYLKHGLYHFVQSDLGKEFECEMQNEINAYFGISKLRTTAFKPSSNPIERGHRTLNAMIGKLIDKHKEWSQYMDYIALAYNSTCHKSTSFTPNFLHFGRELNSSVDVLLANPSDNVGSSGEFIAKMVDGLAY